MVSLGLHEQPASSDLPQPQSPIHGTCGSGPTDLAMSLLCDVLGERPSERQLIYGLFKAYPHHQDFKHEVVAGWEIGSRFEIDSEAIAAWLRKRGAEVKPCLTNSSPMMVLAPTCSIPT